jgi:diazepam-binding inhibitor (GABA receptor modulating acyl-CoA-binding protein)
MKVFIGYFLNLAKIKNMSLDQNFEQAQLDVKTLTSRPGDMQLLDLYALFKQATEGDNDTSKPGMFDMKGQFKWKAWKEKEGMSQDEAKQKYIDLVNGLLATNK